MEMNSKRPSSGHSKSHANGMYGSGLTARDLMEISSILKNRSNYCSMKETRERENKEKQEEEFPRPMQFSTHILESMSKKHKADKKAEESKDMHASKAISTKKSAVTAKSKSISSSKESSSSNNSSPNKKITGTSSSSRSKTTVSTRVPRVTAKKEKKIS